MELTQQQLKELLHYDSQTGVFRWRVSTTHNVKPWSVAGCVSRGYVLIRVNKKLYFSHRLAWLYMTGKWPTNKIDHIDGVPSNNALINLREATQKQNMENVALSKANTSGFRGVSWDKSRGKWQSKLRHHGKTIHLGRFETVDEATKVVIAKRAELFTHDTGRDQK